MKKTLLIVCIAVLPGSLFAEGFLDDAVMGVALVNQIVDIEVGGSEGTSKYSESGTGLGVYLDYYYRPRYRINGTLSYIPYDDFDIVETVASADYLLPVNETISLFAGLSGGIAMQKFNDAGLSDAALGIVYGAQLGGIVYINEQWMFEAGYRLRLTDLETDIAIPAGTTTTVSDLNESYLGVVMKF